MDKTPQGEEGGSNDLEFETPRQITFTVNTKRTSGKIPGTEDITTKFKEAASGSKNSGKHMVAKLTSLTALGTGQLVKDEYFTLFEAVGALEVLY